MIGIVDGWRVFLSPALHLRDVNFVFSVFHLRFLGRFLGRLLFSPARSYYGFEMAIAEIWGMRCSVPVVNTSHS